MNSTPLLYLLSLLSPCQPYAFHLVTEARSEMFPPAPQGCLCQSKESEQNCGAEPGPRTVRNELISMCEILSSSLPFTYSSAFLTGLTPRFQRTCCLSVGYSALIHIHLLHDVLRKLHHTSLLNYLANRIRLCCTASLYQTNNLCI